VFQLNTSHSRNLFPLVLSTTYSSHAFSVLATNVPIHVCTPMYFWCNMQYISFLKVSKDRIITAVIMCSSDGLTCHGLHHITITLSIP